MKDIIKSLAMIDIIEPKEELEPYTIPAHQNGDDVVDEETVFPKEEEADFTGATTQER